MRTLWLPEVLRAAGLTVVEVPGWRTLGSDDWNPTGGIVHATADGAASNPVADAKDDAGAINVIRNGRPGLSGPIASAYQSRSGVWHVIASGRSNTALTGTAGPLKGLGNSRLLGIEHENDNRGELWPSVQYDSAIRGWAAICRRLGWSASRLAGHKEHDPGRKSDPKGIDMSRFRADVARLLAGEDDMATPEETWTYESVASDGTPRKAKNVLNNILEATQFGRPDSFLAKQFAATQTKLTATLTELTALRTVVQTLASTIEAGGGSVDTAAILAGVEHQVAGAVAALRAETRDAVADLGEGGSAQVRADQD